MGVGTEEKRTSLSLTSDPNQFKEVERWSGARREREKEQSGRQGENVESKVSQKPSEGSFSRRRMDQP